MRHPPEPGPAHFRVVTILLCAYLTAGATLFADPGVAAPDIGDPSIATIDRSTGHPYQSPIADLGPEPIVRVLLRSYPDAIVDVRDNRVVFSDGRQIVFDDGESKTPDELLANPDVKDMFTYPYVTGPYRAPAEDVDPGRIRNEAFFAAIYGDIGADVESSLVDVVWLPGVCGTVVRMNGRNGVANALDAVSQELLKHPELHRYVANPAGGYVPRCIANTDRPSMHAFGIAFDINPDAGRYWIWDIETYGELRPIAPLPEALVAIFEAHGFIWGGRWYHYDSFHFEFRPELLPPISVPTATRTAGAATGAPAPVGASPSGATGDVYILPPIVDTSFRR